MTKRTRVNKGVALGLAALLPGFSAWAQTTPATAAIAAPRRPDAGYARMVERVAAMPDDNRAQDLVERRGLSLLNVMWEDTGRWLGSSVGPNISDVTIEVEMNVGGRKRTALMPVVRHENFSDLTGDVALEKLRLPVGNQAPGWKAGDPLETITLRDFLAAPGKYLTLPGKGTIKGGSLLARRDRHALVSAQSTFLPVPKEGTATFWPVIFNYQSTKKNPAVLTLLVTRQGTSATIIDNARDTLGGGSWGQRLFFNAGGERSPLTAERRSAVERHGVTSNGESAASLGEDANLLMLVQIPLKYRQPPMRAQKAEAAPSQAAPMDELAYAAAPPAAKRASAGHAPRPDVEAAVLGHGPELGPYTELDGLGIERDPRFPVRVTVQFYQATSNGVLSPGIVKTLSQQIRRVYRSADYVGSLVVPAAGEPVRSTAWDGTSPPPAGVTWWDFPGLVERAPWNVLAAMAPVCPVGKPAW
jgi:hypothetical protein